VFWEGQGDAFLDQSVRLHHRSVRIHPFSNGNGRWARMLANIWLKRQGQPITAWPEEAIGSKSVIRDEYIAAIRAADEGDEWGLRELHQRFTPGSAG
jgi:Fic family protein